jgi:hypothetical protein
LFYNYDKIVSTPSYWGHETQLEELFENIHDHGYMKFQQPDYQERKNWGEFDFETVIQGFEYRFIDSKSQERPRLILFPGTSWEREVFPNTQLFDWAPRFFSEYADLKQTNPSPTDVKWFVENFE